MATDNSEPRVGMITGIGVGTVVLLIGIRAALQSYFIDMNEAEQHAKVLSQAPAQLATLREAEQRQLTSGAMSIERAMQIVGQGNRAPEISPMASTDFAALQGWTQRPTNLQPAGGTPQASAVPQPAPAQTAAGTVGGPTQQAPEASTDAGVNAPTPENTPGTSSPPGHGGSGIAPAPTGQHPLNPAAQGATPANAPAANAADAGMRANPPVTRPSGAAAPAPTGPAAAANNAVAPRPAAATAPTSPTPPGAPAAPQSTTH